jgi:hypothetical protein
MIKDRGVQFGKRFALTDKEILAIRTASLRIALTSGLKAVPSAAINIPLDFFLFVVPLQLAVII